MSTVAKNFRIDSRLNEQATDLFNRLGLSMSQAFSLFLQQAVLHRGLPFKIELPRYSTELIAAIKEAKELEANPHTKRYTDMDENVG